MLSLLQLTAWKQPDAAGEFRQIPLLLQIIFDKLAALHAAGNRFRPSKESAAIFFNK